MPVNDVEKDVEALTMTIAADLDGSVERVWQLWADPNQFEKWWGPPGYQPTVVDYDLRTGGRISFNSPGPDGNPHDSLWEVLLADPPHRLEIRDADVDADGRPNDGNSMTLIAVTIEGRQDGTLMTISVHFDSLDGMEREIGGFSEGMRMVLAQIEALLASSPG